MELERIKKDLYINFMRWESKVLISALKKQISYSKIQIKKVENDIRNEGQLYYVEKIRDLKLDIKFCNELIDTFTDKSFE
jgi:hypothetical protein